jgi:hypothetical protein
MFDRIFTTPYFIYYGQDGQAPAPVVDGADHYIYAISNNGFWCNGDAYILGRVAREKIGRLDPGDWVYYRGGDGLEAKSWTRDTANALPVIENPLKCGEAGATYLPALGRYLLVAWYYPGDPNVDSDETHFIYYEAPHPWGPWTAVKEDVIRPEGWYCPRVLAKWQAPGMDELKTILVTGGDYYEMGRYYCFTVAELAIKAGGKFPPEPPLPGRRGIANTAEAVRYTGGWQFDPHRGKVTADRGQTAGEGEFFSQTPGDTITIPFIGGGVQWHTSKENNLGLAAVRIDDGEETLVDLYTYAVVPLFSRLVFDSGPLEPGPHTFKVRVTGQKNSKSSGVGVYHNRVEVVEGKNHPQNRKDRH